MRRFDIITCPINREEERYDLIRRVVSPTEYTRYCCWTRGRFGVSKYIYRKTRVIPRFSIEWFKRVVVIVYNHCKWKIYHLLKIQDKL